MSPDKMSQLHEGKVIPDVLSEGTSLSYDLVVKWPNAVLDTPGKLLDREDTQPEPTLQITHFSRTVTKTFSYLH
jgi:phosphatidylethanolamine-binding protein